MAEDFQIFARSNTHPIEELRSAECAEYAEPFFVRLLLNEEPHLRRRGKLEGVRQRRSLKDIEIAQKPP